MNHRMTPFNALSPDRSSTLVCKYTGYQSAYGEAGLQRNS
uniref:Uncharacterized protein n=1 Tax=Anguilla anguilla TaxID=7936 RepID=A0A0E9S6V0_ANGAN